MKWSYKGPISGMRCTQILETADKSYWEDNYLCVPHSSNVYFRWFSAGVSGRGYCPRWHEGADPNTWHDNFLCVAAGEKPRSSDGSMRVVRYYNSDSKGHYYNIHNSTKAWLENYKPWKWDNHGYSFRAFPSRKPGTVPIYHCWSSSLRTHVYGRWPSTLKSKCGKQPTIAFYGYSSAGKGRKPIRQLWHPSAKVYLYSNGEADANNVASRYGFQKHGIAWYAPE